MQNDVVYYKIQYMTLYIYPNLLTVLINRSFGTSQSFGLSNNVCKKTSIHYDIKSIVSKLKDRIDIKR